MKESTDKCEGRKGYAESASEILEEIKRLRRKPKRGKRLTFAQVADALNQKGYRMLTRRPFNPMTIANILRKLPARPPLFYLGMPGAFKRAGVLAKIFLV
jgi:hypothetical protein